MDKMTSVPFYRLLPTQALGKYFLTRHFGHTVYDHLKLLEPPLGVCVWVGGVV